MVARRAELLSLLFAAAAAAYLLVVPVYSTTSIGNEGVVTSAQTLLEVSGNGIVFLIAAPVVFAALPLLVPRRTTRVASAILLAGVALLVLATIGWLFLPSAAAMAVAAVRAAPADDARQSA